MFSKDASRYEYDGSSIVKGEELKLKELCIVEGFHLGLQSCSIPCIPSNRVD